MVALSASDSLGIVVGDHHINTVVQHLNHGEVRLAEPCRSVDNGEEGMQLASIDAAQLEVASTGAELLKERSLCCRFRGAMAAQRRSFL